MYRTVIAVTASGFVVIAIIVFMAVTSKHCTGNVMSDDVIACGLVIGEQK